MELNEIEKAIADFEAKLKPIKEGQTTLTQEEAGVSPLEGGVPPPPEFTAEPGEFCLTTAFKQLVLGLKPDYIGDNIDNWLIELLQQPDCSESKEAAEVI